MKRLFHFGVVLLTTLAVSAAAYAQATPLPSGEVQKIYDRLRKQIDRLPIYDNHSHATFPDAQRYAQPTGLPVIECSFCRPADQRESNV